MKEIYDLRIRNEYVDRVLEPGDGKKRATVTILKVDSKDPKLKTIEKLYRELLKNEGKFLFSGWVIERSYEKKELEQAQVFFLTINSIFEPPGELLGTKYNDSMACPKCGAGAPQISALYLSEKRIPTGKDISRTIAGEIIVSRKLKELFIRHQITGIRIGPVCYSKKSSAESADWFQLFLTDTRAKISPQSQVKISLFREDLKHEYRCSQGDTVGLNLISELFIDKASPLECDFVGTSQFLGARQGVLRPERKILIWRSQPPCLL